MAAAFKCSTHFMGGQLRLSRSVLCAVSVLIMLTLVVSVKALASDTGKQVFNDICRACHQKTGHGIEAMKAPAIAGLPRWYVSHQIRQFKSGVRGRSAADRSGQLMSKIVTGIDDLAIAHVSGYIQKSLVPLKQRQTTAIPSKQEVALGKTLYEGHCQSCHAAQGRGKRTGFIPPLNKQQDWYLHEQIEKFTNNARLDPVIGKQLSMEYAKTTAVVSYLTSLQ